MSVSPLTPLTASGGTASTEQLSDIARAKAAKLSGAALRNASAPEQRAAVAAQFEAILVRQLLGKTMTSMMGGGAGGVSGSIYGDMLADTISQQLTAGQGLGLGRVLEQQLKPKGEAAAPAEGPSITDSRQSNRPASNS